MSTPHEDLLGRTVTLVVDRLVPPGAMLRASTPSNEAPLGAARDVVLLPRNEVTDEMAPGDALDVFVYLDSDDRPIATRKAPLVELDEVAFLEVTDVGRIGAFVHWGPVKELLVPHAEQTQPLHVGDRHPIALYLDPSGRLAGSMRVTERLKAIGVFEEDEWVDGEAWRKEPGVGVFVIVERAFVGLVPEHEPNDLRRGEAGRFRVTHVHPDGRIELSLRGHAHEEVTGDAQKIMAFLEAGRGPRIGDRSSPEELRALFGLSKKAFKRAAGRLYKDRAVIIDDSGFLALPRGR
jgi:predicted RNA-binding protein (virulence factor B family)